MDDIDCANERGELYNVMALQAALAKQAGPLSTGVCRTCGELIERERLRANGFAQDCIDCASEKEAERHRVRRRGAF